MEYREECIFEETYEKTHYNTYWSTKHSNDSHKLYLAFDKYGHSRKVQVEKNRGLNKKIRYAGVLTHEVSDEDLKQLNDIHPMRHHHMCPSTHVQKIEKPCKSRTKSNAKGANSSIKHPRRQQKTSQEKAECPPSRKCKKHKTFAGDKKHPSASGKTSDSSENADDKEATTVVAADDGEV